MGGNSQTTKTSTVLGDTKTINPYAAAHTNNSGTVAAFQPGTALESVYNFVNSNMGSLLDEYLNPNINSVTNQAKLNAYTNALDTSTKQNLANNIINPLSNRRMVRSSQATDLYKNLSNQNTASLDGYIADLLSSAQNDSANMINNLLKLYMNGYDVLSDTSDRSLNTSSANSTRTTTTNSDSGINLRKLASQLSAIYGGL